MVGVHVGVPKHMHELTELEIGHLETTLVVYNSHPEVPYRTR